jgi:hypothetical protein
MPSRAEKMEALRKAGLLRRAADASGISFAKLAGHRSTARPHICDRPRKTPRKKPRL